MSAASVREVFTPADLTQLGEAGIEAGEALRQVLLLRSPPGFARLDRPCTPGDGILPPGEVDVGAASALFDEAVRAGRCSRFVPASGAATRMFHSLLAVRALDGVDRARIGEAARAGSRDAVEAARFLDNVESFAFSGEIEAILARRGLGLRSCLDSGDVLPILDALLSPEGPGGPALPKALLAFHRHGGGSRTAFEEHLVEAAKLTGGAGGICRVHLTIAAADRPRFEAKLSEVRGGIEREHAVVLDVSFSAQKRSTDTLSLDAGGLPIRDEGGELLLRPSGHGALLENLDDMEGDLVLVKNIDNVAPDPLKGPTLAWIRILGGIALDLQRRCFELLGRIEGGDAAAVGEAIAFAGETFGRGPASESGSPPRLPGAREGHPVRRALRGAEAIPAADAAALLERPIRVCGMVVNTGEPGGGPFWLRSAKGPAGPQIVEGAQIDRRARRQEAILAASTHTNPVFMACAVRDRAGRPFDLTRFVDPEAVIITRKSHAGRELTALERPGLWNGGMAEWSTLFVEVPLEVFNPVKTVNDLLRPAHRIA